MLQGLSVGEQLQTARQICVRFDGCSQTAPLSVKCDASVLWSGHTTAPACAGISPQQRPTLIQDKQQYRGPRRCSVGVAQECGNPKVSKQKQQTFWLSAWTVEQLYGWAQIFPSLVVWHCSFSAPADRWCVLAGRFSRQWLLRHRADSGGATPPAASSSHRPRRKRYRHSAAPQQG